MAKDEVTTIQIDVETRDKLKALAVAYERTAAGQLRWMVSQEFDKLAAVKMVPQNDEPQKEQGQGMLEFAVMLALVVGVLLAFGLLAAAIVIFVVIVLGPIAGRVFPKQKAPIPDPSPKSKARI